MLWSSEHKHSSADLERAELLLLLRETPVRAGRFHISFVFSLGNAGDAGQQLPGKERELFPFSTPQDDAPFPPEQHHRPRVWLWEQQPRLPGVLFLWSTTSLLFLALMSRPGHRSCHPWAPAVGTPASPLPAACVPFSRLQAQHGPSLPARRAQIIPSPASLTTFFLASPPPSTPRPVPQALRCSPPPSLPLTTPSPPLSPRGPRSGPAGGAALQGRPEGGRGALPGQGAVCGERRPEPAAPSGDHQRFGITIWQHVLPARSPPSATRGSLLRRCPQQLSAHARGAGDGGAGYGAARCCFLTAAHARCGAGAAGPRPPRFITARPSRETISPSTPSGCCACVL